MKFYAYKPTPDGYEPMGSFDRILFELKTIRGAISRCNKIFGENNYRLFTYSNIYVNETFREIKKQNVKFNI